MIQRSEYRRIQLISHFIFALYIIPLIRQYGQQKNDQRNCCEKSFFHHSFPLKCHIRRGREVRFFKDLQNNFSQYILRHFRIMLQHTVQQPERDLRRVAGHRYRQKIRLRHNRNLDRTRKPLQVQRLCYFFLQNLAVQYRLKCIRKLLCLTFVGIRTGTCSSCRHYKRRTGCVCRMICNRRCNIAKQCDRYPYEQDHPPVSHHVPDNIVDRLHLLFLCFLLHVF